MGAACVREKHCPAARGADRQCQRDLGAREPESAKTRSINGPGRRSRAEFSYLSHQLGGANPAPFKDVKRERQAYTLSIKPADDVYVDKPYLSITWDSLHQHVFSEWKGFANSEELRAGLMLGIKAISDNHAAAYVSDARRLRVIVRDDQTWIQERWMPLALQAGLRRLAFVTAGTGLGRLTVEDVVLLVDDHGLESRTFTSVTAARSWVAAIPAIP